MLDCTSTFLLANYSLKNYMKYPKKKWKLKTYLVVFKTVFCSWEQKARLRNGTTYCSHYYELSMFPNVSFQRKKKLVFLVLFFIFYFYFLEDKKSIPALCVSNTLFSLFSPFLLSPAISCVPIARWIFDANFYIFLLDRFLCFLYNHLH